MASTTPYGYLKDKDDPNVWIVDEEAAVVVRRIFHMTMDGYGSYQIAKALKEEKKDNRHERVSVKEKLAEKKDAVIKMNAGKEHSAPEKKKEAVI